MPADILGRGRRPTEPAELRRQEAASEAEARFQAIFDNAEDAVIVTDTQGAGSILAANPAACRLFGYTEEELLRLDRGAILDASDPRLAELTREREEHGRAKAELTYLRKDGTRFTGEVTTAFFERDGAHGRAVGIIRDITERRRVEDALRASESALREANEAKDHFIALVSHELRNPLSAISSAIAILDRLAPADPRARRAVATIERNASLQKRLINDLMDLSRLQRHKLALQRTATRVDLAVEAALQSLEGEAGAASIRLSSEVERGLWVQGDPDRLQQVVVNLLGNAIKFTPAGGSVCVRARRSAEVVRVAVEDTGAGIDRSLQPRLFDLFEQGALASRRKKGLGLGLALVKSLVEQHSGRVWVESDGLGKGSSFFFELPAIPPPSSSVARDRRASGWQGRPIRVLLVEDQRDTRAMLEEELRLHGYEVCSASSGEQALELLQAVEPLVIVSDIQMPPGMNGYELIRRARALPGFSEVPAFAVTAYGQVEDVRLATEAGFVGHFTKPVNVRALDDGIRSVLRSRAQEGASDGERA